MDGGSEEQRIPESKGCAHLWISGSGGRAAFELSGPAGPCVAQEEGTLSALGWRHSILAAVVWIG